jgi:hypothetical protein
MMAHGLTSRHEWWHKHSHSATNDDAEIHFRPKWLVQRFTRGHGWWCKASPCAMAQSLMDKGWLRDSLYAVNDDAVTTYSNCLLPHRRVHKIKHTYLASRTHGLFITETQSFISTIYTLRCMLTSPSATPFSQAPLFFLPLSAHTS